MQAEVWTVIEVVVDGQVIDRRVVDRRSTSPGTRPGAGPQADPSQPEKLRLTDAPAARARPNSEELAGLGTGRAAVDLHLIGQVRELREFDELWRGYDGLSDEQVCSEAATRKEITHLRVLGVADAAGVVLSHGPKRVGEVRRWVDKIHRKQGVSNKAGLLLSTLSKGIPKTVSKEGNRA